MIIICDSKKQERSVVEMITRNNCPCDAELGKEYKIWGEKCTLNCEECWKGKIKTEVRT